MGFLSRFYKYLLPATHNENSSPRTVRKKNIDITTFDDHNPQSHSDSYYYNLIQESRKKYKRGIREGFYEILNETIIETGQHILDVGTGTGLATEYFLDRGLTVTATGLCPENFGIYSDKIAGRPVRLVECLIEHLPFKSENFDAIWLSHVLEHTMNPGIALQELHRVLKTDGYLFIMVPPYKSKIVGGHLMTGWNLGQLMFILLLNNFNVKDGHFVKLGYNICAFVRKADYKLPPIHYDNGDLEVLTNYWPIPMSQGVEGDIESINWPPILENSRDYVNEFNPIR